MTAVRFTFDDDFDNSGGGSLSQKKMEDLRATIFAEGQEAGRTEILDGLQQNCENLLQNIFTAAQTLTARQDEQVALMHKETAKLAYAIIEKLAPAMVEKTPLTEIEVLVEQCLRNSPLEPRLVIRVDDTILPTLQAKLEEMQAASGYQGQVILISEAMAHISDCRVEWANGGVGRDFTSLLSTIENTVQLFIDAPEK
ncbi:MAG: hypothetical protein JKY59_04035 [Emcibacter sp.]|nr:hypothetical protein [Emcibacter sp.]